MILGKTFRYEFETPQIINALENSIRNDLEVPLRIKTDRYLYWSLARSINENFFNLLISNLLRSLPNDFR